MNWKIPAKTFLLGEYAALIGQPAILLTTTPYFELSVLPTPELQGIHSESPAGRFWKHTGLSQGLGWQDPYLGVGGMGASSAQFLGAYLAYTTLTNRLPAYEELLTQYFEFAWTGVGEKPSGYDVLAQANHQCVLLDKIQNNVASTPWPFDDLTFVLLHTGKKLATHDHLKTVILSNVFDALGNIAATAQRAFLNQDSEAFVHTVNAYYQQLLGADLVAPHTQDLVRTFQSMPGIKAAKGCGALGSDVILLLISTRDNEIIPLQQYKIMATSGSLATEVPLLNFQC